MMLRFPQKEFHILQCRDKNFNIGLQQKLLVHFLEKKLDISKTIYYNIHMTIRKYFNINKQYFNTKIWQKLKLKYPMSG